MLRGGRTVLAARMAAVATAAAAMVSRLAMVTAACVVTRPPSRGATSSQVRSIRVGERVVAEQVRQAGGAGKGVDGLPGAAGGRRWVRRPAQGDLGDAGDGQRGRREHPGPDQPRQPGQRRPEQGSDPAVAAASPVDASGCVARTAHRQPHSHGGGQLDERQPGRRRALADQLRVVPASTREDATTVTTATVVAGNGQGACCPPRRRRRWSGALDRVPRILCRPLDVCLMQCYPHGGLRKHGWSRAVPLLRVRVNGRHHGDVPTKGRLPCTQPGGSRPAWSSPS